MQGKMARVRISEEIKRLRRSGFFVFEEPEKTFV